MKGSKHFRDADAFTPQGEVEWGVQSIPSARGCMCRGVYAGVGRWALGVGRWALRGRVVLVMTSTSIARWCCGLGDDIDIYCSLVLWSW